MSLSHQYHQPNAPDSPSEDSESDLDLDLQELDPATTAAKPLRPSRHGSRQRPAGGEHRQTEQGRLGGIALRNFRGGDRNYGPLGRRNESRVDGSEGDARDGLDEGGNGRRSEGSFLGADDDAPLLRQSPMSGRRRKRDVPAGAISRLTSKMGLANFSNSSRPPSPTGEAVAEGVEEEDHDPTSTRIVAVGQPQAARYPPNSVSNARYTPWSFLPLTLYNEFSFFFNLYFLLVALSQLIPALRIGYISTYIAPLAFVLSVTLGKEALDDVGRRRRDGEANAEGYTVLRFDVDRPRTTSRLANGFRSPRTLKRRVQRVAGRSANLDVEDDDLDGAADADDQAPSTNVRETTVRSRDLKVGDVLKMEKGQRVPADVVVLKSFTAETAITSGEPDKRDLPLSSEIPPILVEPLSDPPVEGDSATKAEGRQSTAPTNSTPLADAGGVGETFIRTDQLDGETDWKLRLASPLTQSLAVDDLTRLQISAGKPEKKVHEFVGKVELLPNGQHHYDPHIAKQSPNGALEDAVESQESPTSIRQAQSVPLTIDNTAWANTVLASNATTLAVVVYTGCQTRQALSTSPSRSKTGLLEYEINSLTKILCIYTLALSVILVALEGFKSTEDRKWYVAMMLYLILFSTIIPISLRVNLDMGKTVYAWFIERDQGIKGAVVRTSTIPEELGRVEYLLSDKTGTLTQNEMELKKIHVGTVSYANEAMDEVASYTRQAFSTSSSNSTTSSTLVTPSSTYTAPSNTATATRTRREIGSRVRDLVLALALCHNVTPTSETENGRRITSYQASSPDEIAIVQWTESVGLRLMHRDRTSMMLQSTDTGRVVVRVRILEVFPFTSESKRMGLIAQFHEDAESRNASTQDSRDVWFFQKGADTVMTSIVAANDWLDEETANMAREGLRTLVVGRKKLSPQQYAEFAAKHKQASMALHGRDTGMAKTVKDYLERDLELLGVTGVEDKLQRDVKPSLELLRNAGIKIWMLTGDKIETARCVAISSKLVARGQYVHTIAKLKRKDLAQDSLDFLRGKPDSCLLIDGESLALFLTHFRTSFISVAVLLPAVVACRCSPTQKADVAKLIRAHTKKRICCIGDGGNDVSMIQAADVGVGIVGKEGRQASLAADFSIEQFCHLTKLLVWHGRNSYKRSAKLAQFVIHRGLIISVCQTMFSIASKFEPNALYKDWLLVGYATVYTMAPVFSLVLDKDVDEDLANLYPELYKELTTGRSLSYRTFLVWVLVSVYQGGMIQGLSQILVGVEGPRMVSVSFTVLIINELIMVAFEITTWHPVMVFSLIGTALVYFGSVPFLGGYYDLDFVVSLAFVWRVTAISAISLIPPYAAKLIRRTWKPPSYRKVQGL